MSLDSEFGRRSLDARLEGVQSVLSSHDPEAILLRVKRAVGADEKLAQYADPIRHGSR